MKYETIGIYGLGKVGMTLARAFMTYQLPLMGVASYNPRTQKDLPTPLWSLWCGSLEGLLERCRIVFLTIRDSALPDVVHILSNFRPTWEGYAFVHCSGAIGADIFVPLQKQGAEVGQFHILNTFPDRMQGADHLIGSYVAIHGTPHFRAYLEQLANRLNMQPFHLPNELLSLYHLIAVFLSNAPIVLSQIAYELYIHSPLSSLVPWEAYAPLVKATAQNMVTPQPIEKLTGPWQRRDELTIQKHREVLENTPSDWKRLYELLHKLAQEFLDVKKD